MTPRLDVELLTTAEVAELLRVTPRTVREWAKTGKLPGAVFLTGRALRFRKDAIEAALQAAAAGG